MSTVIAKTETKPVSLSRVNQSEIQQMIALDQMLGEFRRELANPDVGDMARMLIQARAITALDESITTDLMKDVMKLMNNPLGFKTDRATNGGYDEKTVKRCLIVAWLSGAKATGNEFNIIAGNCYLTKEFARPAILRFPGLTDFDEQIGVPVRFGEKAAICDAVATWYLRGELHEVRCVKSESIDARIVVNCYATSSPDELRGKVQSKLYRRVLSRLTGLNLCPDDSDADASNTIDATPRAAVANIAAVETAVDPEAESSGSEMTDSEAAKLILADAEKEFAAMTMKTDVKKYVHNRNLLIAGYAWSEDMKMATSEALVELADARIAEIGASRGK